MNLFWKILLILMICSLIAAAVFNHWEVAMAGGADQHARIPGYVFLLFFRKSLVGA